MELKSYKVLFCKFCRLIFVGFPETHIHSENGKFKIFQDSQGSR